MVQLLKYKSKIITPDKAKVIIDQHKNFRRKDLASLAGVNECTLKHYLKKMALTSVRSSKTIPFPEQKVSLVISGIKRKYYTQALLAAQEAVKAFKCKR